MEKNIYFIIFTIGFAILLIAISVSIYLLLKEKKLPETYDCYIFSVFWTPSSCGTKKSNQEECYQRIKSLGIEKYLTIHGLWPSTLKGIIPPACNEGIQKQIVPNFDSDKDYIDKMEHYWPGLYSNNTYLWTHEYNKHGYCYMKRHYLNFVDDYEIYFNKSIELFEGGYREFIDNMYPDSRGEYNISKAKFKELMKKKLNISNDKTFCLMCHKETNLLSEIYFIYDLNYKLTTQEIHQEDCPDFFMLNFTDETKKPVWENFDIFVFAVQYSPNICVEKGKPCLDILEKKKYYKAGIHGLWPSYKSGIIPQECNLGKDIEIIVEHNQEYFNNYILPKWFSLFNTDDYFLTHEYNTHGYCYNKNINKNVGDYEVYLNKTIDIYDQYNFSSTFDDIIDNLSPGEHVIDKSELLLKIENKFRKKSFVLRCNKYNNKLYLTEIHFTLNKHFELTSDANLKDTCQDEQIWFNVLERVDL